MCEAKSRVRKSDSRSRGAGRSSQWREGPPVAGGGGSCRTHREAEAAKPQVEGHQEPPARRSSSLQRGFTARVEAGGARLLGQARAGILPGRNREGEEHPTVTEAWETATMRIDSGVKGVTRGEGHGQAGKEHKTGRALGQGGSQGGQKTAVSPG